MRGKVDRYIVIQTLMKISAKKIHNRLDKLNRSTHVLGISLHMHDIKFTKQP